MSRRALLFAALIVVVALLTALTNLPAPALSPDARRTDTGAAASPRPLPSPRRHGELSLEEVLAARRSRRTFAPQPLTAAELGQLLWAAQGVTDAQGRRTTPSAGALYPLEIYAVEAAGLSRYLPQEHALLPLGTRDLRADLRAAALDQAAVGEAPLVLVVSGVVARTAARYGLDRAARYVALEAGHAAQNVLLEAVALGLAAVPVGAFDDARVAAVLGLAAGESPLYLLPVGRPG